MKAKIIAPLPHFEDADWHDNRAKGIGGSEIAAILGKSPWATPYSVWSSKTGKIPPKEETPAMRFGTMLESLIAELYMAEKGIRLTKITNSVAHPLHPEVRCTPDYVDLDNKDVPILSIKYSPYGYAEWGEPGTDQIPKHCLLQCYWEMEVFDREQCDVAVSFGKPEYKLYHVKRDRELGAWLIKQACAWCQKHIVEGVEPEVDGSIGASEYLKARFPRNVSPLIAATPEVEGWIDELNTTRTAKKTIEEKEALLENRVKTFIGDAEGVQFQRGKCTWKTSKPSQKIDWESVARSLNPSAELIAKFTEEKPGSRRFLLTMKGDNNE